MKVFLDSNVVFSIAYTGTEGSRSYLIYEIQAFGRLRVLLSDLVCKETIFNIRRKKPEAEQFLDELIRQSKIVADVVADLKHPELHELPINDRVILSTAVNHKADIFVTGNERDFKNFYHKKVLGTLILKPIDFLSMDF